MIVYPERMGPTGTTVEDVSGTVRGGLRRGLSGVGGLGFAGACFAVFAVLFLGSILLTPHGLAWWLDHRTVPGREVDGIVTYSWHGQQYSADDPGSHRTGPHTVWLIPGDPADGRLDLQGTLVLDWTLTAGLAAVGAGFVAAGSARSRLLRRRRLADPRPWSEHYGDGIDPDTIRHLLAQQRRDAQTGRSGPAGAR